MLVPQPLTVVKDGGGAPRQKGVQQGRVNKRSEAANKARRVYHNINQLSEQLHYVFRGTGGSFKELGDVLKLFADGAPTQHPQLDPALAELARELTAKIGVSPKSEETVRCLKELAAGLKEYHSQQLYRPLLNQALETVALVATASSQTLENGIKLTAATGNVAKNLERCMEYTYDRIQDELIKVRRENDQLHREKTDIKSKLFRLELEANTKGKQHVIDELGSLNKQVESLTKQLAQSEDKAAQRLTEIKQLTKTIKGLQSQLDFMHQKLDYRTNQRDNAFHCLSYYGGYDPEVVTSVQNNPRDFPPEIWGSESAAFTFVTTELGVKGNVVWPLPDHIAKHQPSRYLLLNMANYYAMKLRNPEYKTWAPHTLLCQPVVWDYTSDEEPELPTEEMFTTEDIEIPRHQNTEQAGDVSDT